MGTKNGGRRKRPWRQNGSPFRLPTSRASPFKECQEEATEATTIRSEESREESSGKRAEEERHRAKAKGMGGDAGERFGGGEIETDRVSEKSEEGEDGEEVGGEGEEDGEAQQGKRLWPEYCHRPRIFSPHDPL